ncbi:chitin-binding domain-containing protein [Chondromyces crocatus]|uniref:Chitin-binding type-2 domain-containing protein n=1 Tax=Chondromyces crocatus TaxID=52 RepID=A0A0K1EL26_CHOCO|nr:chitin-binding domain-containing protein [Chondromyces crocatus]AKT41560.1 uncharacterized protein CMC5_057670 [Chondromyces crocatus]
MYTNRRSLLSLAAFGTMLFGLVGTATPAAADTGFVCPGPFGFYADPNDCATFYFCMMNNPFPVTCPEGTFYDGSAQRCMQDEAGTCGGPVEEAPVEAPPAEGPPVAEPPVEEPPAAPLFECPQPNGVFSNPDDCVTFYTCNGGVADLRGCPSDLHWNQTAKRCDLPENSGCSMSAP